jgi:hypothetical protein
MRGACAMRNTLPCRCRKHSRAPVHRPTGRVPASTHHIVMGRSGTCSHASVSLTSCPEVAPWAAGVLRRQLACQLPAAGPRNQRGPRLRVEASADNHARRRRGHGACAQEAHRCAPPPAARRCSALPCPARCRRSALAACCLASCALHLEPRADAPSSREAHGNLSPSSILLQVPSSFRAEEPHAVVDGVLAASTAAAALDAGKGMAKIANFGLSVQFRKGVTHASNVKPRRAAARFAVPALPNCRCNSPDFLSQRGLQRVRATRCGLPRARARSCAPHCQHDPAYALTPPPLRVQRARLQRARGQGPRAPRLRV